MGSRLVYLQHELLGFLYFCLTRSPRHHDWFDSTVTLGTLGSELVPVLDVLPWQHGTGSFSVGFELLYVVSMQRSKAKSHFQEGTRFVSRAM